MHKTTKAKLQCFIRDSQTGRVEVVRAKGIDNSFPRHSHQSYCLGLVEQGCRLIMQEGQAAPIPEGSLFIIQPKQSHACRSPQAEMHSYSVLCLPKDYIIDLANRAGLSRGQTLDFSGIRLDDEYLASAFHRLLDNISKGVSSSRLDAGINKLAADLLIRHAQPVRIGQPANVSPYGPVMKARHFLESKFDQPVALGALSRAVGLSQFHLQRKFLKSMGCSPKEYLLHHRIKVARQLLLKGLPFSQVALETGFYDQGHFTNRFRTVMGVTPGRFSLDNRAAVGTEP